MLLFMSIVNIKVQERDFIDLMHLHDTVDQKDNNKLGFDCLKLNCVKEWQTTC